MAVEAQRARVSVEASQAHALSGGGQLEPRVEVGMRHDAGDGRTGTGAEVGGGMRYTNAAQGLTLEGRGRVLLGHNGDYEDWGLGGLLQLSGGRDGHGLSFSLQPTWGATGSRAAQVWAQEAARTVSQAGRQGPRNGQVEMNLGYGLGWDEVMMTPYGRFTLTNGPARVYRLGSRMQLGGGMTFNMEGTREETAERLVNHGLRMQFGVQVNDWLRVNLEGLRQQNQAQALNHGIKLEIGLGF